MTKFRVIWTTKAVLEQPSEFEFSTLEEILEFVEIQDCPIMLFFGGGEWRIEVRDDIIK